MVEKWWCFFGPLSSLFFLPFPSLKKGWQKKQKKTLFYRFFATPFYNLVATWSNNHQNKKCKTELLPLSWRTKKTCFGTKHQETTKTLHTPLKTWFRKSSETTISIEQNDVYHLLTLQCGPLIGPKTPECRPLLDPKHIYIYVYLYIYIYGHIYISRAFAYLFCGSEAKTCLSQLHLIKATTSAKAK